MVDGVEWNVRVAEMANPDIIQKFKAVFESYWQLSDYKPYNRDEFGAAISRAAQSENLLDISPFAVEPRPFQQRLLDDVAASRAAGFHRNLVVAATGTGKTVMSAFDYEELSKQMPSARLLFVAHRKEILSQSRKMFAQIMRDPSFGELWVDGERPRKFDHVFASIQTLRRSSVTSSQESYSASPRRPSGVMGKASSNTSMTELQLNCEFGKRLSNNIFVPLRISEYGMR
jgi:type I site-specific restriction endonuclease